MNLDSSPTKSFHVVAEIVVDASRNAADALQSDTSGTVDVAGTVAQARTGIGIPGLRVIALAGSASKPFSPVGHSVSDSRGQFRILFDDSAEARQLLLAWQKLSDSQLTLRVDTPDGVELFTSDPLAAVGATVRVTLAVTTSTGPVAGSAWELLGTLLQRAGIVRLSDVVKLLVDGAPLGDAHTDAPVITTLDRQAMLDELEQAFLDPTGDVRRALGEVPSLQQLHDPDYALRYTQQLPAGQDDPQLQAALRNMLGKAASFVDLGEVDWTIDTGLVRHDTLGAAIDKFSDRYHFGNFDFPSTSDLGLYRDYLRGIWTTFAAKIVYVSPHQLTEAQALEQLTTRFHQDFTTYDDAPRSEAVVLILVVKAILTAPTGKGFGFGIALASIAPQGARTSQAYLGYLIGMTGLSPTELGLRYRLDFGGSGSPLSSPVQANITTIQRFFRDSFQSDLEPQHVDPDIHNQPIIPDKWQGNAPFFLYFDEWQRQQQPFYPENHLDIRRVLPVELDDQARIQLANLASGVIAAQTANVKLWKFCQDVLAIWDALVAGHTQFYAGEYGLALVSYRTAQNLALNAMQDDVLQGLAMAPLYNQRKSFPLHTMKDLPHFMNPYELAAGGFGYADDPNTWAVDRMGLRLAYYALVTIPMCLGDAEYAMGDHESAIFYFGQATRFEVGIARETDAPGYRPWYLDDFEMFWRGDKPYTVRLNGPDAPDDARYPLGEEDADYDQYYDTRTTNPVEQYSVYWSKRITHLAEQRYCRLRQANAMLEWADTLYRLNEPTPMARARELYKGVLWLHGRTPPIAPAWPKKWPIGGPPPMFAHQSENPALTSETARALRGVYQIDHGLNYYGEANDVVPILRYRPLKDTADRTAAMARGAQQDFLQYTQQVEAAMTARLQLSNFLQKAKLQSAIADEQRAIAQHDVVVAQDQVVAVQAAIKAKQDDIAQHDSLFGQIGDAISGISSLAKGIPGDTTSAVGAGIVSEATGDEMVGAGILGLGAGASVMTGIGIFAVVGYITLSGMADADNKRSADLHTLTDKGLPAAQAVVEARNHSVVITGYQKQIAQADVDLAQTLLAFEQDRTLNQNFWLQLSQVAKRTLRRYLDLGARQAWLTERALAYEQDRTLNIVRMDYFPAPMQGIGGADLMQADLAELDATRIEGMKRTVPVRRSISLVREFPMQYALLRTTGRCAFRTEESYFQRAYPGTSAYRIRAVSATVQQRELVQPMRGSLINRGVSISKPQQPGEHILIRPGESLPLSEFRLGTDMAVYGLPNDTLLTFEGSDVETFWELSFPKAANPAGLDSLVDVTFTFDLFCEFSPERYEIDLAAQPTSERKWILISAARHHKTAVTSLSGPAANVDVIFDLPRLGLFPRQESSKKIKNVAVIVVSTRDIDFTAKLSASTPTTSFDVPFSKGVAISTLSPSPVSPPLPSSPLNALEDLDPDQTFTLAITKAANPGADFGGVADVVLAIEYEATLV